MRHGLSITIALSLLLILPARPVSAQTTLPSYPDSVEGLTQLMKDLLTVSEARNEGVLILLTRTLKLPNHKEWFTKTFGPQVAPRLITEFEKTALNVDIEMAVKFFHLKEPSKLVVAVQKVEAADDLDARVFQRFALAAMQNPTALYSVTITLPQTTAKIEIWNLVYSDGAFRVVGKLQTVRG